MSHVGRFLIVVAFLLTILSPDASRAEWLIPHGSGFSRIDFEQSVANVNNGRFAATGLAATPSAGQLDSDTWLIAGFSSGDTQLGQSYSSGDYARGVHAGGTSAGGLYAFETSPANRVLGAQPTSSDFNPGWMQLSIASTIAEQFWTLSFDWWVYNDKPRSTRLQTHFSSDGANFQSVSAADLTTPTLADASATWQAKTINPLSLDLGTPSERLWIRWSASDFAGSSSRDEFGIDNIAVQIGESTTPTSSPEPSAVWIWVILLGTCGCVWARGRAARFGTPDGVCVSESSEGSAG